MVTNPRAPSRSSQALAGVSWLEARFTGQNFILPSFASSFSFRCFSPPLLPLVLQNKTALPRAQLPVTLLLLRTQPQTANPTGSPRSRRLARYRHQLLQKTPTVLLSYTQLPCKSGFFPTFAVERPFRVMGHFLPPVVLLF